MNKEMRQLRANLQLAGEAAEDVGAEKEEVEKELRSVQRSLDDMQSAAEEAQANDDDNRGTIRDLTITLATHQHYLFAARRSWTAQQQLLEGSNATLDRIAEEARQAGEGAKGQISLLSKELLESQTERDDLQLRSGELQAEVAAGASSNEELRATINRQEDRIRAVSVELVEAKQEIMNLELRIEIGEQNRQTDSASRDQHQEELEQAQAVKKGLEVRIVSLRGDLDAARFSLETQTTELQGHLDTAQIELEKKSQAMERLQSELSDSEDRIKSADEALSAKTAELDDLLEQVQAQDTAVVNLTERMKGAEIARDIAEAEATSAQQTLAAVTAQNSRITAEKDSEMAQMDALISDLHSRLAQTKSDGDGVESAELEELEERVARKLPSNEWENDA